MIGELRRAAVLLSAPSSTLVRGGCGRLEASSPNVVLANRTETVSERDPRLQALTRVLANRGDADVAPWMSVPVRGLVRPVARAVPALVQFAGGKSSAPLMIVRDDRSAPVAAECVTHDPGTGVRVVAREDDRIWFEVEFDGGVEDQAIRPLAFRVERPVQATINAPIVASASKLGGDLP